jgi:uncharacterized repeat protein (TIGR03803 family)
MNRLRARLRVGLVLVVATALQLSLAGRALCQGTGPTEKVLYRFSGKGDGALPYASPTLDGAGNLYVTTNLGGSGACTINGVSGCGVVFELTPMSGGTWKQNVLHSFMGGNDGQWPISKLSFDSDGNLYGTTVWGGSGDCNYGFPGCGTIFELTPNVGGGWTEAVLYSFQGSDGALPYSGLTLDASGSSLYGTTFTGGQLGYGTVFGLVRSEKGGWAEQVLHSFLDKYGSTPEGDLLLDAAGNLYGTTYSSPTSLGCVFELEAGSGGKWKFRGLHDFKFGIHVGAQPNAGLTRDSAGRLYGTTTSGGRYGKGSVFQLVPTSKGWPLTRIHDFNGSSNGDTPHGQLIMDAAGNLYGTTSDGGRYNFGVVFKLTPAPTG